MQVQVLARDPSKAVWDFNCCGWRSPKALGWKSCSKRKRTKRTTTSSVNEILADAVLTAYEVSALDLHGTKLVILSPCATLWVELRNDKGAKAMRWALYKALSRRSIISMRPVPDAETQELLTLFYGPLAERGQQGRYASQTDHDAATSDREVQERHPQVLRCFRPVAFGLRCIPE